MPLVAASLVSAVEGASPPATLVSKADAQFFESNIRPVLIDKCYKCHSHEADRVKGGLMLDSREGILDGGNTGVAVDPGKPDKSLLIEAIRYTDDDLKMPPKGDKLSDKQISDFTEWVKRGAPVPLPALGTPKYGGVGKNHWAFQPVKSQLIPTVSGATWCKTPIDNFVLEKLEENKMQPNPAADKRTLIRRATFDLIGLPPTEDEVQAFLTDDSPEAFSKVVDRLLASPHYGERWGRYWLDVARYADTKGDPAKRTDNRLPFAWTYRDYVIDAFNNDLPYNQFIIQQLAADRLVAEKLKGGKANLKPEDQASLAALGFLTIGNEFEGNMNDVVNDRIDVTTKAFLGLTVACARCHDHKFDPIPQKDYYSLFGIFANTSVPDHNHLPPVQPVAKTPELQDYLSKLGLLEKKRTELEDQFALLRKEKNKDPQKRREITKEETQVAKQIGDLDTTHPGVPPFANVLIDVPQPHDYPVLLRGEAANKGDVVPRRFLEVLSGPKRKNFTEGSGRLELAKAITDPANPMTARVLVNRVWQQHFGNGIVLTPDDLGNMSSPPTHPELLDYLAKRFEDEGWSIKKLQRLIMLSSVYQQSAAVNPAYADSDPDNKLLWRFNVRRLDFEEVHDSLLSIAGTLDPTMGGKPVPLGSEGFATRRAVYTLIDRRNPPELLTQFDFPNPGVPSGRRYLTFVPQQSLFLMNSQLVIETARKLVHRPDFTATASDEDRVKSLFLAVYQRPPTSVELSMSLQYVETALATAPSIPVQPAAASRKDPRLLAKAATGGAGKKGNGAQPEPGQDAFKSRAPVDAWTKLAHALFQTNEAMFYD